MFQALFLHLEGGFEREDRVTMLYGHDAACRKGSAVTNAVHLVNDWHLGVARPHEIPVQGMDMAIRLDGTLRRDQRLGYGLSAEDALPIQIGAATTEQVVFQPLQVENAKQFVHCRHAASPFGRAAGFRTGYGGRQEAERRLRQRTSFPQVKWRSADDGPCFETRHSDSGRRLCRPCRRGFAEAGTPEPRHCYRRRCAGGKLAKG